MKKLLLLAVLFMGALLQAASEAFPAATPDQLPLKKEVISDTVKDGVRLVKMMINGRQMDGEVSRIYAVYALPEKAGKYPLVLHIHGCLQTVDDGIVTRWAQRGYAAVTYDHTGNCGGNRKGKGHISTFGKYTDRDPNPMLFPPDGTFSRIDDIMISAKRVLMALEDEKNIDTKNVGITGISLGGFSVLIFAGQLPQIKAAVNVYGCGFEGRIRNFTSPAIRISTKELQQKWFQQYDPTNYLKDIKAPILTVSGTNDGFFPLDALFKTHDTITAAKQIALTPNVNHTLGIPYQENMMLAWFNHYLKQQPYALPKIAKVELQGNILAGRFDLADAKGAKVNLNYAFTTDVNSLERLNWRTKQAEVVDNAFRVELPDGTNEATKKTLVCFATVTSANGLEDSSKLFFSTVEKVYENLAIPGAVATANLFEDSSFEKVVAGSNVAVGKALFTMNEKDFHPVTEPNHVNTGARALMMENGGSFQIVFNGISGEADYILGMYLKGSSPKSAIIVTIHYMDAGHKVVGISKDVKAWRHPKYTFYTLDTKIPAGAVTARLRVASGSDALYLDDLVYGPKK